MLLFSVKLRRQHISSNYPYCFIQANSITLLGLDGQEFYVTSAVKSLPNTFANAGVVILTGSVITAGIWLKMVAGKIIQDGQIPIRFQVA